MIVKILAVGMQLKQLRKESLKKKKFRLSDPEFKIYVSYIYIRLFSDRMPKATNQQMNSGGKCCRAEQQKLGSTNNNVCNVCITKSTVVQMCAKDD